MFDSPRIAPKVAKRGNDMLRRLSEVKQKMLLAESAIEQGSDPNLVVPRLIRELRWEGVETWINGRPTTGDLYQAINIALKFIVTTEMPDSNIKKISPTEVNAILHRYRMAGHVYSAFSKLLKHQMNQEQANEMLPFDGIEDMAMMQYEIENGA